MYYGFFSHKEWQNMVQWDKNGKGDIECYSDGLVVGDGLLDVVDNMFDGE